MTIRWEEVFQCFDFVPLRRLLRFDRTFVRLLHLRQRRVIRFRDTFLTTQRRPPSCAGGGGGGGGGAGDGDGDGDGDNDDGG